MSLCISRRRMSGFCDQRLTSSFSGCLLLLGVFCWASGGQKHNAGYSDPIPLSGCKANTSPLIGVVQWSGTRLFAMKLVQPHICNAMSDL